MNRDPTQVSLLPIAKLPGYLGVLGERFRFLEKRNWFTGCVVLTKQTFAAFALGKPIIYVPLDHERLSELRLTVVDGVLFVGFDAAVFNDGWTGMVECRFKTSQAQLFVERLAAID